MPIAVLFNNSNDRPLRNSLSLSPPCGLAVGSCLFNDPATGLAAQFNHCAQCIAPRKTERRRQRILWTHVLRVQAERAPDALEWDYTYGSFRVHDSNEHGGSLPSGKPCRRSPPFLAHGAQGGGTAFARLSLA